MKTLLSLLLAFLFIVTYGKIPVADSERLNGLAKIGNTCGTPEVGIFGDVTTIISSPNIYYKVGDSAWRKSAFKVNGAHSLTRLLNGHWLIVDTESKSVVQLDDLSGEGRIVRRSRLAGFTLNRPHDEIVDPKTGDVYVIDGNRRLFRFHDLEGPIEVWTFTPAQLGYDRSVSWFDGHLHIIDSSRGEVIRIDNYAEHRFTTFRSPRPEQVAKYARELVPELERQGIPKSSLKDLTVNKYNDFPAGALSTTGLVLNSVVKAGGWYYGSNDFLVQFAFGADTRPARLIRWRTWSDLERGNWEDLSSYIPKAAVPSVPYFLTIHDNVLYAPLASWRGELKSATCEDGRILQLDLGSLPSN